MRLIKRCTLALAGFLLCFSFATIPQKICFADGENNVFFCGNSSSDCRIVEAGNFPILTKLSLRDVCGESAEYASLDVDAFLRAVNGEILFCEELFDSVNYYCKADLPYGVYLYGKEINLHICLKQEGAKVASPIIFGGY